MDTFLIEAVDMKSLEKITIGHNSSDEGMGWYLEKVIISVTDDKKKTDEKTKIDEKNKKKGKDNKETDKDKNTEEAAREFVFLCDR